MGASVKSISAAFLMTGLWFGVAAVTLTGTPAAASTWLEDYHAACLSQVPDVIAALTAANDLPGEIGMRELSDPPEPHTEPVYREKYESDLSSSRQFVADEREGFNTATTEQKKTYYRAQILRNSLEVCRLEVAIKRLGSASNPPTAASNSQSGSGSAAQSSRTSPTGANAGSSRVRTGGASSGNTQLALNAPSQGAASPGKKTAPAPVTSCVTLDKRDSLYGGFYNNCNFKVWVSYCAYHPKKGAWNELFDCEKQAGGMDTIGANDAQAAHTNGTFMYWFACPYPSWPVDGKFVTGKGIYARCM